MKANQIKEAIETGARVVRDVNGDCGVMIGSAWEHDITRKQFGVLIRDTDLCVDFPVGSVYTAIVTRATKKRSRSRQ